ncbi:MAG: O-antigen ligase family protein, partial [Planctomycetaceae bacterium]|nr:O-antigen ligase family protein [Planctomycetaceae bacterium]
AQKSQATAADRFAGYDNLLLAAVTCLLVVTPLIPSEATVHEGIAAPLNLLWTLALIAWAALLVLRPDPQVKFGWTELAAAALVGWHTLSGVAAVYAANGRQALNMTWQMLSYATAAFLLRQLLRTPAQCRALVVVMIALASLEAVQGYYEYFISKPAALVQFHKNPEQAYQELGAVTQSQREHLRWRIENIEPIVTFALTNSLAGLLAPWLIALMGIALSLLETRSSPRALAGAIVFTAVILGCLLLTKSRTAVLATAAGIVLLALYGRSTGWRIGWRVPLIVALIAVVIGLGVVAVGGLDVQVLSEAPTSVLYRIQYWRSTAAIIAEYPLLGCGPGQFQEAYAAYKLPEASETPRDPHNFLLEIWSTAGTPALLALLLVALAFAGQLAAARLLASDVQSDSASRMWLYGGALAGLVFSYPLGLIVGYPPKLVFLSESLQPPGIWLWGLPAAAVCVWALDPWVRRGRMPAALPVISLIALLVNLLAAGAASFPGVFQTAWILVPLALANSNAPAAGWSPSAPWRIGLLAFAAVLAVLCMKTAFSPVLTAPARIAAAEHLIRTRRYEQARHELTLAAADDPWSPVPQRLLAILALDTWIGTGSPADWEQFAAAVAAYQRLSPRHHATYTDLGRWYLLAWRRNGDPRHLDAAINAYRQAVMWYPGRALERIQLAWALHLAGRDDEAAQLAAEAQRLDDRNPHLELKLSRQTVYDPPSDPANPSSELPSAELILRKLRKPSSPEKPR